MALPIDTTFQDGVTAVLAAWLNRMQEALVGLAHYDGLTMTTTTVVLNSGSNFQAAVFNLNGDIRYTETNKTVTFSGADAADTYGLFAVITGGDADPAFSFTKVQGSAAVPADPNYMKLGTVVWDGATTLSNLQVLVDGDRVNIISSTGASRPAAGWPGRLHLATDTNVLSFDRGTSWEQVTVPADAVTLDKVGPDVLPAGVMWMYGAASAPTGWLLCNGSAVSRTTYADLFAAIGVSFGIGNGSTTFNVPDMRNNFPVGTGSTYSLNDSGGAATHTLTEAEMPQHDHGITNGHAVATDPVDFTEGFWQNGAVNRLVRWGTTAGAPHYDTWSADGSGNAHENLPPYLGVNFIIKT